MHAGSGPPPPGRRGFGRRGHRPGSSRARSTAAISGNAKEPGREPRPRLRATDNRTSGIRHLFAAYDLGRDKLYGYVRPRKTRTRFLEFCRYVRRLHPLEVRMAIVVDNFSRHLTTS